MNNILISVKEFEEYAEAALPKTVWAIMQMLPVCDEFTLTNNRNAFNK
jgi:hypothetical protein